MEQQEGQEQEEHCPSRGVNCGAARTSRSCSGRSARSSNRDAKRTKPHGTPWTRAAGVAAPPASHRGGSSRRTDRPTAAAAAVQAPDGRREEAEGGDSEFLDVHWRLFHNVPRELYFQ